MRNATKAQRSGTLAWERGGKGGRTEAICAASCAFVSSYATAVSTASTTGSTPVLLQHAAGAGNQRRTPHHAATPCA